MISNADHLVNEEKRSLPADLDENQGADEAPDAVAGQTADDRKAVARLGGGGLALLGIAAAMGFGVGAAIGRPRQDPPEKMDAEREGRVTKIKAAAQERREQRNARRLAHANRGSRIDQTDF